MFSIHQQASFKLLTIWSTHCDNIANNVVDNDIIVNNIATMLFNILSISTVLLPYMITVLLQIVDIGNIVAIL